VHRREIVLWRRGAGKFVSRTKTVLRNDASKRLIVPGKSTLAGRLRYVCLDKYSQIPTYFFSETKLETQAALETLKGHSDSAGSVVFSPDSKLAASRSDDGTVRLWDTATEVVLRTLEGHSEPVSSVSFSSDGKRIASGSLDKTVQLRSSTADVLGPLGRVTSVAFSPDGKLVVSGSGSIDKTVCSGMLQQELQ
jgi:WD40 repeat protein